jgi:AAA+ ATPase superfamily predicted ATPase
MFYLSRLQAFGLIERRLPVVLNDTQRRRSKRGRYFLRDPYFHFYFRFIDPHLQAQANVSDTMGEIRKGLPKLVAKGFEALAREWIRQQAQGSQAMSPLPFTPEAVGSHWSQGKQANIVAINWRTRDILLGACDWRELPVGERLVDNLLEEKTSLLRRELPFQGENWTFHYVIFPRIGLTEAAQTRFQSLGGLVVPLPQLERGLSP